MRDAGFPVSSRAPVGFCGGGESLYAESSRAVPWDLGNGITRARPKITTITKMSTRFASETKKMFQWKYFPGWLRSTAKDTKMPGLVMSSSSLAQVRFNAMKSKLLRLAYRPRASASEI